MLGNCVWPSGCIHIEEGLNEGPRLQYKQTYENETKLNKRNVRERQPIMIKKHPKGTSSRHLRVIKHGKIISTNTLALGNPVLKSFPSRSGILLHAVVQPRLSLQRSIPP